MKSAFAAVIITCFASAQAPAEQLDLSQADIVFMGEFHDNADHHLRQAEWVKQLAPKALVFEMLTEDQAERHVAGATEADLEAAFDWNASGWPAFETYFPIFAAAHDARVFGAAVPREAARRVGDEGMSAVFGRGASAFGLLAPLPDAEQTQRETMQMEAHCNALPETLLPMMVDIQRLRDAQLARAAIEAVQTTGGPVAVITGNGHARSDWGAPVYVRSAAPQLRILSLGQGEIGKPAPDGQFDQVATSPSPERKDPCAAFN